MYEQLKQLVSTKFKVPEAEIVAGISLTDLGLDSLDMVELSLAVEQELGVQISDDELAAIGSLDSVAVVLASRAVAA